MRRREMERFINDIIAQVEVVEYGNEGEEGNVYIDEFARQFIKEYRGLVSRDKFRSLVKFIKDMA